MHINLDLKGLRLCLVVFVLSFFYLGYLYSTVPALFTIALSVVIWLLYRPIAAAEFSRKVLVYAVFFITPLLTYTGQIAVLTGFGGEGASLPWVGGVLYCKKEPKITIRLMKSFGPGDT